jgi:hypothetical protein
MYYSNTDGYGSSTWNYSDVPPTSTDTTGITNANTGGGSSFNNQPAFLEMQYIIKT